MLTTALKGVLEKSKIDPALIDDVCVGTVLAPGSTRANEVYRSSFYIFIIPGVTSFPFLQVRIACYLAGLPTSTSVKTVNRQCSSGLFLDFLLSFSDNDF